MARRVLVTGAGGFIGSHLVEELVQTGFSVRAFVHYNAASCWYHLEKIPAQVREQIEVVAGDVADAFAVDQAVQGCEMVFHLAALIGIPYSYVAPAAYVSTNITGTLNVLQACRRHNVHRLLHTSTSETYGTAQYVPIDEKHPLVGQSPYSATKIAADKLAESFWCSFDLPVCIVRPFNTYGPRQSARAIVPTIITQALAGDSIRVGNLDPVRDLTFVRDTARGFIAAAGCDKLIGQTVNLGVGTGFSIREILGQIEALLGKQLQVQEDPNRVRPARSEVQRLISDNSKMRQLTGWAPNVDLPTGLKATIEHIRQYAGEYKVGMYCI